MTGAGAGVTWGGGTCTAPTWTPPTVLRFIAEARSPLGAATIRATRAADNNSCDRVIAATAFAFRTSSVESMAMPPVGATTRFQAGADAVGSAMPSRAAGRAGQALRLLRRR